MTQSVNPASASSGNNNPIGLVFQYKPTPAGGNFQRPSLMSCVAGMSFGGLIYQHVQIDISDRFERPALITYSRLYFIKPFAIFLCSSKKGRIAFRIEKTSAKPPRHTHKAHFTHSICLHPKYAEDTQNSHYVHAYYRPHIFHFNPFIDYRKEAKNDAQLQLLAKRS